MVYEVQVECCILAHCDFGSIGCRICEEVLETKVGIEEHYKIQRD